MKLTKSLPTVASVAIAAVALLGVAPHGRMMAGSPGMLVPRPPHGPSVIAPRNQLTPPMQHVVVPPGQQPKPPYVLGPPSAALPPRVGTPVTANHNVTTAPRGNNANASAAAPNNATVQPTVVRDPPH